MITFVLGIDHIIELAIQNNYPTCRTLTITNVESYYNFRSFGQSFKLVSSILSGNNNLIDLTLISSVDAGQTNDIYEIVKENMIREEKLKLHSIVLDQRRIRSAIVKVNSQGQRPFTSKQTNYDAFFGHVDEEEDEGNEQELLQPIFCRDKSTANKKKCMECTAVCSLSIEGLLDKRNPTGQVAIVEELHLHGHPKSRLIDGQQRVTTQAAKELVDHYVFVHKKKLPISF